MTEDHFKPGKITSHSFRAGLISMFAKLGHSDQQLQAIGRWSSRAYAHYIKLGRSKRHEMTAAASCLTWLLLIWLLFQKIWQMSHCQNKKKIRRPWRGPHSRILEVNLNRIYHKRTGTLKVALWCLKALNTSGLIQRAWLRKYKKFKDGWYKPNYYWPGERP